MLIYSTLHWREGFIVLLDTKHSLSVAERCFEGLKDNSQDFHFDLSEAKERCELCKDTEIYFLQKEKFELMDFQRYIHIFGIEKAKNAWDEDRERLNSVISELEFLQALDFSAVNVCDPLIDDNDNIDIFTKKMQDFYKI